MEVVVRSYRHRLGLAAADPALPRACRPAGRAARNHRAGCHLGWSGGWQLPGHRRQRFGASLRGPSPPPPSTQGRPQPSPRRLRTPSPTPSWTGRPRRPGQSVNGRNEPHRELVSLLEFALLRFDAVTAAEKALGDAEIARRQPRPGSVKSASSNITTTGTGFCAARSPVTTSTSTKLSTPPSSAALRGSPPAPQSELCWALPGLAATVLGAIIGSQIAQPNEHDPELHLLEQQLQSRLARAGSAIALIALTTDVDDMLAAIGETDGTILRPNHSAQATSVHFRLISAQLPRRHAGHRSQVSNPPPSGTSLVTTGEHDGGIGVRTRHRLPRPGAPRRRPGSTHRPPRTTRSIPLGHTRRSR